ncbi:MAG: UDP-N-acetylglucosamine 2-epimerase (non-hydrolyzing) [Gammaproteobacteria bacterium]|jgi:UDP-N-acetylglucosamine 2-epimerase (non-hydrolysing)
MKKLKVMTVLGTRPDVIKLSLVIAELDKFTNHILVHTGQNYDYELNAVFFDELGLRQPDYLLNIAAQDLAVDMANIIKRCDEVLVKEKPDAILFYGDTNSTLAVIPAKRRKIPIFHMEAGNRCFDYRVPEEINRKIIDHLSDINMTISEHARRYLINEGLRPETVIKVGSCMQEIYQRFMPKIQDSAVLKTLKLRQQEYFLVSIHREDNVDSEENLQILLDALAQVESKYNKRIIISTHPRTQKKLKNIQGHEQQYKKLEFLKPFGFIDYVNLQLNAFCVLSDSGSITEESSILKFPAVTLRRMHERPEGMDVGALIMSGFNVDRILQAIEIVTEQLHNAKDNFAIAPDYDIDNVSKKVVRIITSYVDYINRVVWHKK